MEFGHEELEDGHSHFPANAANAVPPAGVGAGGATARAMLSAPAERSPAELEDIVRELLATRYAELDAAFKRMPEWNSLQLTQEALYQLLRRYTDAFA